MRFSFPISGLLTSTTLATNLYVSSYANQVTSLQLTQLQNGSYDLKPVSVNNASTDSPSLLMQNPGTGVVYLVNEGLTVPNGSIVAFTTSRSGKLTEIDRHETVSGPVSTILYNKGKALASAHYSGSAVTTWNILSNGSLSALQQLHFTMKGNGTNPLRQDAPHPHEVIVDPTDSFILAPDLGADLVRIFSIDASTSALTEITPFTAPPGSGPRHGAFSVQGGKTYFYLASELANTVAAYSVAYGTKSLKLTKISSQGIYGNISTPAGAAAAELIVSPDNKFVLTSSRNATVFNIANFDPTNSTLIASDTLQSWTIKANGTLSFNQLAPAGGSFPRQFSVNKEGTLAAVGLQESSRVVIVKRDVATGQFGDFVADVNVPGQVTSVIWDEVAASNSTTGIPKFTGAASAIGARSVLVTGSLLAWFLLL